MELLDRLDVDFVFKDHRGSLTQLAHGGYEQVNVLFSRAGVERGGHYHRVSNECFYVAKGSVRVTARLGDHQQTATFGEQDFFRVRPLVVHSMFFPEDCILVAMYDRCVELEDGTKDIYRGE